MKDPCKNRIPSAAVATLSEFETVFRCWCHSYLFTIKCTKRKKEKRNFST